MDPKPLDQEDINNLSILEQRKKAVQEEIQAIGIARFNLDIREEQAKVAFKNNNDLQLQLGKFLQDKYGEGTIDTNQNLFIPSDKK